MTRRNASRIIGLLDEFGPGYFEVSQLTRIAPEEYRPIAPAVRGNSLHVNGEAIALIPENAARISAAVKGSRGAVQPDPPVSDRARRLDRRCDDLAEEISRIWREAGVENRGLLEPVILKSRSKLDRLYLEMGI